ELTPAPVDDEEVRQVPVVLGRTLFSVSVESGRPLGALRRRRERAAKTAREDLVHRAIVVVDLPRLIADGVAAHVERPVTFLVEFTLEHGDDRADGVAPAEMRDVAALDAARQDGQPQPLLKIAQPL